jgi:hypothetical protein
LAQQTARRKLSHTHCIFQHRSVTARLHSKNGVFPGWNSQGNRS